MGSCAFGRLRSGGLGGFDRQGLAGNMPRYEPSLGIAIDSFGLGGVKLDPHQDGISFLFESGVALRLAGEESGGGVVEARALPTSKTRFDYLHPKHAYGCKGPFWQAIGRMVSCVGAAHVLQGLTRGGGQL